MVCSSSSIPSLAQWIWTIDQTSKAHGERRPRIHVLSEHLLIDKLGDIAHKVFDAVDQIANEMHNAPIFKTVLATTTGKTAGKTSSSAEAPAPTAASSSSSPPAPAATTVTDTATLAATNQADVTGFDTEYFSGDDREETDVHGGSKMKSQLQTIPEHSNFLSEAFEMPQPYFFDCLTEKHNRNDVSDSFPMGRVTQVLDSLTLDQLDTLQANASLEDIKKFTESQPWIRTTPEPEPVTALMATPNPGLEDIRQTPLAVRPVAPEMLAKWGALDFFPFPTDLTQPGVSDSYSITRLESQGSSDSFVIRDRRTGRWETRKRVVLDVPRAVLVRELWVELTIPPLPARSVEVVEEKFDEQNFRVLREMRNCSPKSKLFVKIKI